MRYFIKKIKNGTWQLEWEDGAKSLHSTEKGALLAALQVNK